MKNLSKIIIILIIAGVVLPSFSFAVEEMKTVKIPETIDEAKQMGLNLLPLMPGFLQSTWQEALTVWKWCFKKAESLWISYIAPSFNKYILPKIKERTPIIKEEFEKEKGEMKQDAKTVVPEVSKSLWGKFKELIK